MRRSLVDGRTIADKRFRARWRRCLLRRQFPLVAGWPVHTSRPLSVAIICMCLVYLIGDDTMGHTKTAGMVGALTTDSLEPVERFLTQVVLGCGINNEETLAKIKGDQL